ncbi:caltractin-like [Harmonia axyridis]|uniref:caltractin-like n=1 Tax=Harmonia axyridis TaxID=115357 RepID=UPI001E2756D9|nr:caltractin-like [Harmonia axyridis]
MNSSSSNLPFRLPSETTRRSSNMEYVRMMLERPFRMKMKITEEQKSDLLEAFNLFDLDGDGNVTNSELRVAIRALGFEVQPEDIKKLKEAAQVCIGINKISFDNFLDLMETKMVQRDDTEEIIKYFNLIDTDGKGKINIENLRKVAKSLGEEVTDEVLQEMLFEAGSDEISVDDLIKFIKSSIVRLQELYNKR